LERAILKISDIKEPVLQNITFTPLWQKVWLVPKVQYRQTCSYFGCVEEVHRELHFMLDLHTRRFHHCGWTDFPQQM